MASIGGPIEAGAGGGTGDSSDTEVLFNNSDTTDGMANVTFDGTDVTIASGTNLIPLGAAAQSTEIGEGANADGVASVAYGRLADAGGVNSIAIGVSANASQNQCTVVGNLASTNGTSGSSSISIGYNAACGAWESVVIGHSAQSNEAGDQVVVIGQGASASGTGDNGIAIGHDASVTHDTAVAIGDSAVSTAADTCTLGRAAQPMHLELFGGLGVFDAGPVTTQPSAIADASGGSTVDAEARTALNSLLAEMRGYGLIAT